MITTNAERAARAADAVEAYGADPYDLFTSIGDLVCDLFHLANKNDATAQQIIDRALLHFHAEGGDGHTPDDLEERR